MGMHHGFLSYRPYNLILQQHVLHGHAEESPYPRAVLLLTPQSLYIVKKHHPCLLFPHCMPGRKIWGYMQLGNLYLSKQGGSQQH